MLTRIARDDCRREAAGVGQTPQQDLADPQILGGFGRLQNIRHFTHDGSLPCHSGGLMVKPKKQYPEGAGQNYPPA
jgi:hypothetical protein